MEPVAADAVRSPGAQGPGEGEFVEVLPVFRRGPQPVFADVPPGLDESLGRLQIRALAEVARVLLQDNGLLASAMEEVIGPREDLLFSGHQRLLPYFRPVRNPLLHLLNGGPETERVHDPAHIAADS